jgi:PAS domain S-box-containing protein
MKPFVNHWRPFIIGILLMSVIFIVEIDTGLLIGSVGYIFIALFTVWYLRNSRFLIVLGMVATGFIVLSSLLLQTEVFNSSAITIERALSVMAVWLTVLFTNRYQKLLHKDQTSLQQIQAIFENTNEGILFSDQSGKILLANPFIEKLLDYHTGELTGKNIRDLMPSQYIESHSKYVASYVSKPMNKVISRILWAKTKTGNEIPVEINLSHYYRDNELTVIVFMQDATYKHQQLEYHKANLERVRNYNLELAEEVKQRTLELERTNAELKKSQQLYESMAHNFPDGIIGVLDSKLRFVLADGKGMSLLGMKTDSVIGKKLFQGFDDGLAQEASQKLIRVFDGERVSFDVEIKDFYYNVSSVPLTTHEGTILEILVVVKNISEQRKLEENLIKTLNKEKDLNVMKSRFVSMASHEFRTPLTTILSSVYLLENYKGEQLERESKKLLDRIKRAVLNTTEILNEFLSTGKLDEGKMPVSLKPANLCQFLDELQQEVALLKKDNQLVEFICDDMHDEVVTDTHILKNILINLISNSIKYSPADGAIKVMVATEFDRFSISVIDYGMGIPDEEQKFIYQRFFRAHNVSGTQGTGLGLNIVRKYIKLLNGEIEFSSRLNKGTTFTVRFPSNVLAEEELHIK